MNSAANRRLHERFTLPAMYAPVAIRLISEEHFGAQGHAYDISEGGLRFELDRAIEPGTQVAVQVTLPGTGDVEDDSPARSVFAFANIVWLEDEDEPGPVRMAAVFSRFAREGDRERLQRQLGSGRFATKAA
jgi:hypothetical protein